MKVFKTLEMAYEACRRGGSFPVVLNGANEALVALFLEGKIRFTQIQDTLERILDRHEPQFDLNLEGILETDKQARKDAVSLLQGRR